jgi:hypothetical protein
MQFQVPQFIEVEDKVFGPLTIKQFLYIAGGAGLCYLIYRFLGFFLGAIPMIVVAGLAASLAFYKYNNRPFLDFLESSFTFYTKSRLYVWKKDFSSKAPVVSKPDLRTANSTPKVRVPTLSAGKLKELAASLDIKESANPITQQSGRTNTM